MKICKNCKGTGMVGGGFKKRIEREIKALEIERDKKLNMINDKDKNKLRIKQDEINKEFKEKINIAEEQQIKRKSNCCYCNGGGRK